MQIHILAFLVRTGIARGLARVGGQGLGTISRDRADVVVGLKILGPKLRLLGAEPEAPDVVDACELVQTTEFEETGAQATAFVLAAVIVDIDRAIGTKARIDKDRSRRAAVRKGNAVIEPMVEMPQRGPPLQATAESATRIEPGLRGFADDGQTPGLRVQVQSRRECCQTRLWSAHQGGQALADAIAIAIE
jgi:hypothetical protein